MPASSAPKFSEPQTQRFLARARERGRSAQTARLVETEIELAAADRALGRIERGLSIFPGEPKARMKGASVADPVNEAHRAERRRRIEEHLAAVDRHDGQLPVELP